MTDTFTEMAALHHRLAELEAENAKQKKHMKFMEETMDETGSLLDRIRPAAHAVVDSQVGQRYIGQVSQRKLDALQEALEGE
jgi:uncharacterized coiled-coil protein SlyX